MYAQKTEDIITELYCYWEKKRGGAEYMHFVVNGFQLVKKINYPKHFYCFKLTGNTTNSSMIILTQDADPVREGSKMYARQRGE